jgi:cell wall assembly regulator SMI1
MRPGKDDTRSVRWKPYIWKEPRPVEPGELEKLEAAWGVRLPDEYKQVVSLHQGMTPKPSGFKVGRGENAFSVLLAVSSHEGKESYSIPNAYQVIRQYAPPGIYPFGSTPGGEDLCFDYRQSAEQPRIVLVSVDASIHPVANSFQEFLEALFDD